MKKQTEHEFRGRFGKMVMGVNPLLLDEDQLSETQNMQPGFGWRQRRGMSALTATAVASGLRFKSMVQFRDLAGNTDAIIAHTYDASNGERIMRGSALPPNAITWSEMYDLTANCDVSQWANVVDALLVANNKDFLIWRGDEHKPTGVFKYLDSTSKYVNYWEEMIDQDDATVMPLDSMIFDDEVVVVSEMPLDTINIEVGDTNSDVCQLAVYYWNGAFTKLEKAGNSNDATILDEDCATFAAPPTAWADGDIGTGVSTEEVFNDANVFKMDNGALGGGADQARRTTNIGALTGETAVVFTFDMYFDYPGTGDFGQFRFESSTTRGILYYRTGSLTVNASAGSTSLTWDVSKKGWYSLTLVINFVAETLTAYFDGTQLTPTDVDWDFGAASGADGDLMLLQGMDTTPNMITRFKKILIGENLVSSGDDFVDGTMVAGATLAQDGALSWTPPSDEVQTVVQNVPGFVYKIRPVDTLDASTSIKAMSVHSPMAIVENVWNGEPMFASGCYVYDGTSYTDYTAYVANNVEAQAAILSGATTSYALYVGFFQRASEIRIWPASAAKNSQDAEIDAVEYHDNTGAAVSVGAFVDTTLDDADDSSFAQKGSIVWVPPAKEDEKATVIGGDSTPMFWYKIEWDATLSDPTEIYFIQGVPYPEDVYSSYGVFAHKRRAWQIAPLNNENALRYSSIISPNTWNGLDSGFVFFGERPLRAAVAYYNEAVVFADTEIWQLLGTSPSTFGRVRLSSKVGIVAPRSLVTIESGVLVGDSIKNVLAWFFNDGIWMFDNARIWKLSSPDIDNFFDPDHDDFINPDYADQTYGVYDFETQLCMWVVYSGPTATTPTKVIAMHFPSMWFGIFKYTAELSSLLSVISDTYYTVAGAFDNGKFYLLNDGITDLDDSNNEVAVDAFVTTRDMFLSVSAGMKQRLLSVWSEAKEAGGFMELDEFPDGSKTPQNIGKKSLTVLGKIFGAFQKSLPIFSSQKTTKFRVRNRSKNARMILLGHSTTVDKGRSNE